MSLKQYNANWPSTIPGGDQEINAAMDYIRSKIPNASLDPMRPKYHFVPPAKEMIDVWGGMYFDGGYRLFYDLNTTPQIKMGGSFVQLRSEDLIHWDQLPIALMPSKERDELRLNDGCVIIRNDGTPLMYYTSVFTDLNKPREHVPVIGSPDMVSWKRLEGHEITLENHGGPKFRGGWSDVVFFHSQGRTFMIISKCVTEDGKNQIPVYEAEDDSLLKWKYKGVFFDDTGEVINFIEVGGKWVLIYCPYGKPVWFTGTFDLDTCRFKADKSGVLSYGYVCQGDEFNIMSRGFYATSSFSGPDGSVYIIGWMSGFEKPESWDGCISLPRMLTLDDNGSLLMNPAPIVESMRRDKKEFTSSGTLVAGQCFDLRCSFSGNMHISCGDSFRLDIKNNKVIFNDIEMPVDDVPSELRMLVDVSVAELFINGGKYSISRTMPILKKTASLNILCENINGTVYAMSL